MTRCTRPCRYRGGIGEWSCGCDYMGMTHKSRLVQTYKRLGVQTLTREVIRQLEPRNCPFFEKGDRGRVVTLQMPAPRRREPEDRRFRFDTEHARKLWEQGMNDVEIARELGKHPSTVRDWRHFERLPSRYKGRGERPDVREVRRLCDLGLSDRKIAEMLGSTQKRVVLCRRENGIAPGIERRRYSRPALRKAWEAGLSDTEIVQLIGCSRHTVINWREENGLPANGKRSRP